MANSKRMMVGNGSKQLDRVAIRDDIDALMLTGQINDKSELQVYLKKWLREKVRTLNIVDDDLQWMLKNLKSAGDVHQNLAFFEFLSLVSRRSSFGKSYLLASALHYLIDDMAFIPILGEDWYRDKLQRARDTISNVSIKESFAAFAAHSVFFGLMGVASSFDNTNPMAPSSNKRFDSKEAELLSKTSATLEAVDDGKEVTNEEAASIVTKGIAEIINTVIQYLDPGERQESCYDLLGFGIGNDLSLFTSAVFDPSIGYDFYDKNSGFISILNSETVTVLNRRLINQLRDAIPKLELLSYQHQKGMPETSSYGESPVNTSQFTI